MHTSTLKNWFWNLKYFNYAVSPNNNNRYSFSSCVLRHLFFLYIRSRSSTARIHHLVGQHMRRSSVCYSCVCYKWFVIKIKQSEAKLYSIGGLKETEWIVNIYLARYASTSAMTMIVYGRRFHVGMCFMAIVSMGGSKRPLGLACK